MSKFYNYPLLLACPRALSWAPYLFLILSMVFVTILLHPSDFLRTTVLSISLLTPADDSMRLQFDLNIISNWCSDWLLSLSTTKCSHLPFSRHPPPLSVISSYTLCSSLLPCTSPYTYLGLKLSANLSWYSKVSSIVKKS